MTRAGSATRSRSTFRRWRRPWIACAARSWPPNGPRRSSRRFTCRRTEARRGATLPLDVPVCCVCRTCGGRGESWSELCLTLRRHRQRDAAAPGARERPGRRVRRDAVPLHGDAAPSPRHAHRAPRPRGVGAAGSARGTPRVLARHPGQSVGRAGGHHRRRDAAAVGRGAGRAARAARGVGGPRRRPRRRRASPFSASLRWPSAAPTSGRAALLRGHKPVGRILMLALAIANLLVIPFGTALGVLRALGAADQRRVPALRTPVASRMSASGAAQRR